MVGFLIGILALDVVVSVLVIIIKETSFKKTTYSQKTGAKSLLSLKTTDTGAYGEYLIYKSLKKYEQTGAKFFFNLYVPKGNGETAELDAIMVGTTGVYVFESKNYSGWIFGNSKDQYWTQSLRSGNKTVKNRFFNPVMQNRGHIKALSSVLGNDVSFYSFVVFSERCELKKVTVSETDVKVLKRGSLREAVAACAAASRQILDQNRIDRICSILSSFENPDEVIKQAHNTKVSYYNQRR